MKKIVILYHSGVGNTKKVAGKIYNHLNKTYYVEMYSVEKIPNTFDINNYDGIVIGFPVIHTHPTKRILEFIDRLNKLSDSKPTFIFATRGLFSANSLKIFAKHCITKNLIPVVHSTYRCPAADGSLIAPFMNIWFTYEKNIDVKIASDSEAFITKIEHDNCKLSMPRFKLYSIINYPNKKLGQLITFRIYVHTEKCNKCGKCIRNCPASALEKSENGYPTFNSKKCEKCYRCIHHCPMKALSLSKRKTPKRVVEYI